MDLIKTVSENVQNSKSAKEQLHELNEQKKLDLENSLLKEALTESSERCEKLLKELKESQEKKAELNHQTLEEIRASVEQFQTSSEILETEISKEIGNLRTDLQKETVDEVNSIWRDYQLKIEQSFNDIIWREELVNDQLKKQVDEVEQARRQLFRVDGVKKALFWIGMVANITTCMLMIISKIM